jgi:hypothetical protein
MKTPALAAIFAFLNALALPAQDGPPGAAVPVPGLDRPAEGTPAVGQSLKRFDLRFPGGTPGELVRHISDALGAKVNVIIPEDQADTRIMPITVYGVTVPELFTAIETASSGERPVVVSNSGGNKTINFRKAGMGFRPNSTPPNVATVWSFYSSIPSDEKLASMSDNAPPPNVCQYFQLAQYLEDYTVEDITTAIQTGWKMLRIDPSPQLSFHAETRLLIAVGPAAAISQIPGVLSQLPTDKTRTGAPGYSPLPGIPGAPGTPPLENSPGRPRVREIVPR